MPAARRLPIDSATCRVLVVDDDVSLRQNFGAFLEANGYEADCIGDVDSALTAIHIQHYDAVVVDYRLGSDSGLGLLRSIHERYPTCPVILMSAYLDDWLEQLACSLGHVTCMKKPFAGAEMLSALEAGLQRRREPE